MEKKPTVQEQAQEINNYLIQSEIPSRIAQTIVGFINSLVKGTDKLEEKK